MYFQIKNTWFSIITVSGFLLVFFLLFRPILNSDDDFYFLYSFAGGHGTAPTSLLHYVTDLNPLITWPIPLLFKAYPYHNWYSLFLLGIHFLGCVNILLALLSVYSRKTAVLIFTFFFLFFESRLLLYFNYTTASAIAAMGGLSYLLVHVFRSPEFSKLSFRPLTFSIFLLVLSGLLRLHMLALCIILALWLALFLLSRKGYLNFLKYLFPVFLFLAPAVLGNKLYLEKNIEDWHREENIKEAFFFYSNRAKKHIDFSPATIKHVRGSLIKNLFLYDSSFIQNHEISSFFLSATRDRIGLEDEDHRSLYWMFINNRMFLLLLGSFLFVLLIHGQYKKILLWMLWSMLPIGLFIYLFLFIKVTTAIFIALFGTMLFSAYFLAKDLMFLRRWSRNIFFALLVFSGCWSAVLLYKANRQQLEAIQLTRSAINGLNKYPSSLFISVGNTFSYSNYHIWDCPVDYPLNNLLYKELLLNNKYRPLLAKYGVSDLVEALPTQDHIYLIGSGKPLLEEYYSMQKSWLVTWEPLDHFPVPEVSKIRLVGEK